MFWIDSYKGRDSFFTPVVVPFLLPSGFRPSPSFIYIHTFWLLIFNIQPRPLWTANRECLSNLPTLIINTPCPLRISRHMRADMFPPTMERRKMVVVWSRHDMRRMCSSPGGGNRLSVLCRSFHPHLRARSIPNTPHHNNTRTPSNRNPLKYFPDALWQIAAVPASHHSVQCAR